MSIVKDLFIILFAIFFLFCIIKHFYVSKKDFCKQKEYFIKTLSHDLRVSVLAQLRGLDLLKENSLSENDKTEILSEVQNGCKYTFDMITMLVDTYKFEAEKIIPRLECINANTFLNNILTEQAKDIENKRIRILQNKNKCIINVEAAIFKKALNILISAAIMNAYNHTELILDYENNNNASILRIIYKGIPITDEEEKRMFSNNSKFSTVGHGIKMYLCKKIIDFHSGTINIKRLGKDLTIFTVKLPNKTNKHFIQCKFQSAIQAQ